MKKLLFIALFLPLCLLGQTCKVYGVINGHKGKFEISKKELAGVKKLEAGSNCPGDYKVLSYEFTAKIKGQPVSFSGVGATLSTGTTDAWAGFAVGTKIFFDNIKVKGPDGKTRTAEGIALTIKE